MLVTRALNPRRIARSLVTVLALTLLETVVAPVVAPVLTSPKAEAVEIPYTGNTSGYNIVVPAGVFSITLTARGAAGGTGGNDGGALGLASSNVGSVSGTFEVTPGDRIVIYPGGVGGAGVSSQSSAAGGTAGSTSIYVTGSLTTAFRFNGVLTDSIVLNGGVGGAAGSGGSSGGGGGGGAATLVAINDNVALLAGGGGGGGGGSGPGAQPWNGTYTANGTNPTGANGTSGGGCGNTDGGGSGAGGGGWYGGAGGAVDRPGGTGECRAFTGSAGGNFVASNGTSTANSYVPANGEGAATYVFNYSSTTTCVQDTQTNDIYTIVKVTTTAECNWTVPSSVNVIDLFLVGGGGGGAGDAGPGGGGGAVLSRTAIAVTPSSTMKLKVGYGGAGTGWTYVQGAYRGDSTTVVTSTGALFYALGGTVSATGPTASVTGNQTVQSGSFDGGIGGTATNTGNSVGGTGKAGVSNYFYGTQNTYSGGGGGGCYFAKTYGTSVSGAAGANGGGSGCSYNNSTGRNSNGGNGEANRGGGGGGGGAGDAIRTIGGKGGSGVILIRYATNAADSFPASVSSALSARFSPGDMQVLDANREGWIDSSGGGATVATANFTGSPYISTRGTTDGVNQTDSSKTLLVAKGGTGDRITLRDLPTNYTLFSISRYVTGGTNGRLITASGGNWFSGHYSGMNGCAHHTTWLTSDSCNTTNLYGWQLNTDQIKYYRQNGVDVSLNQDAGWGGAYYLYNQNTSTGFGINNDPYGQQSSWEVADILVFNRQLTAGEIRAVENWIARVNGLKLAQNFISSETDTAGVFDGSNYYYGQYLNGMYINDTFTVEGWVNPNAYCDGNTECPIFSYESVLVTRIYQGTFWYALYGSASAWEWTDTNVKFQAGEWHHFAFSKRLTGNQANAVDLYRDGKVAYINSGSPYRNPTGSVSATNSSTDVVNTSDTWYYVGARSGSPRYYGQMDELKIWKVARTASQIASDLNSSDATSSNLQLYYDFNRDSLSGTLDLQNLAWGGHSRSDMVAAGTQTFQDVKIVTSSTPYTTIKFPRNYLTQKGGWKVPTGISQVQTILLGGGGGGGGGYEGGGGGAGGFVETLTTLIPGNTYSITVGTGGRGALNPSPATSGETSTAFGLSALGGGGGASEFNVSNSNVQYPPQVGGSGGGGSWSVNMTGASGTSGQGFSGGSSSRLEVANGACATNQYAGAGGGGAGGSGFAPSCTNGGNGGAGKLSTVLGTVVAGGGGGSSRNAAGVGYGGNNVGGSGGNSSVGSDAWIDYSNGAKSGVANTGGGGGAGISSTGIYGYGAYGGSGIVALRYITALVPSYTKPTNAYLNVGMTETFTTNVAQDSATAVLTRTFKWESTTPTANGVYTTLKVGTGAANAAYSWVPSDTSTSGSGYLYRLTVTDSDTAGLFITDSSTAFAIINPALRVSSTVPSGLMSKRINISRNETYTITLGTPTYRATLSPVIPGITIDTSTAGTVVLKIGETATVGTWLETLTVTDSVSAFINIPLSITVAAPPQLTESSEIVKNGLVFNIDASNSASFTQAASFINDISGSKEAITIQNGVSYASEFSGVMNFNPASTTNQYATATGFGQMNTLSIETYIRLNATVAEHFCPLVSEYTGAQISMALCIDAGRTWYFGFRSASAWTYKRAAAAIPLNTWTHLAGTFDGSAVRIYINNTLVTSFDASNGQSTSGGLTPLAPSTPMAYINRTYTSAAATSPNASYGFIRLYNIGLTETQVAQNYNATKDRFALANLNQITPTKKYGVLNLESFTATSGLDTKTVTFAVGDRLGIDWDTTTVTNQIKLSVQESLSAGIYYDTMTVTDSLGQSSYLPIKFTVTQADTLTVYVDTPTALSYTGNQALLTPVLRTSGAVGLETGATVSATVRYKPGGGTCASGGYCRVGDIGPAGGIIFIDTSTASSDGRIYEAAPYNWSGSDDLATVAQYCSNSNLNLGATQFGIGWGDTNTTLAKNACMGGAVAKVNAFNQSNSTGFTDWFIPSTNEAIELIKYRDQIGLVRVGSNWSTGNWGYWTSTEVDAATQRSIGGSGTSWNVSSSVAKSEAIKNMVRPVRAFKSCWAIDTCTAQAVTTIPTNAGLYSIVPSAASLSTGSFSNYSAVVYQPTPLTINKVAPRPINIPWINTNYPDTFTVTISIYAGSGALKYSAVNGTANGCAMDYKKIYTTSQGTCTITVTRYADRNFLADTTTATILFLAFVNSQPTNQVGGGSTIGLNGQTSLTIDDSSTVRVPRITGFSLSGSTLTINGEGFGSSPVTVTFERYVDAASPPTPTGGGTVITVSVPGGAVSGPVLVITAGGRDSIEWLDLP